jgi:hypothetical protein
MNESFIEYVMNGNIQLKLQRYLWSPDRDGKLMTDVENLLLHCQISYMQESPMNYDGLVMHFSLMTPHNFDKSICTIQWSSMQTALRCQRN